MEQVDLKAEIREEHGKQAVKKLRGDDLIPGVVYKAGDETASLKFSKRDFLKVIHTDAGENVIITLKIARDGKPMTRTVIIKEIQFHPLKDEVVHVDFNEISLTETLTVNVPVELRGEAAGLKEEGVLDHILRELEIECLPTEIPERIEYDVTAMVIGDKVHVKDLAIPKGIKVLTDLEATVVSMEPPTVEKAEPAPEEEITEPEVITEKKGEEEPDEGGAPAEKK